MSDIDFLNTLEGVIRERIKDGDASSYTAKLIADGPARIAQKVGEEGVELALAGVQDDDEAVKNEAADLLYHLLVLLNGRSLSLADVCNVLKERHSM